MKTVLLETRAMRLVTQAIHTKSLTSIAHFVNYNMISVLSYLSWNIYFNYLL